ncbi:RNA polymerase specificity factor [Ascoidea rubescens DSM 1968]|uniref:rRNA adenine N(6)-methyltransferase n=1 Tax=Ascoidea rubescens DSM 1968 TaxID=1344418 RepID=A0A1D2VI44_9ASCO|nr:S-adenosyl-L-methionine-dependent methyltransferase [Ascoidea rubescens DSM 1968]ODV61210.1 S-adenosyl-L-methionine-dependent methyltransferase [Ascoidea rubescens DSM 1968]
MSLLKTGLAAFKPIRVDAYPSLKWKNISGFNCAKDQSVIDDLLQEKLSFLKDSYPNRPERMSVLDMYSGCPIYSSALFNFLTPQKYVIMSTQKNILKNIDKIALDRRSQGLATYETYSADPYSWASFIALTNLDKALTIEKQDYSKVHDSFLITGNLTLKTIEALLFQWAFCMANKNWLQRYGDVRMMFWIPFKLLNKVIPKPGNLRRMSMIFETFTNLKVIASSTKFDGEDLDADYYQLDLKDFTRDEDIALIEITRKDFDFDIEIWEFLTKKIFSTPSATVRTNAGFIYPGAIEWFESKDDIKGFLNKPSKELTKDEIVKLVNAVSVWPFKPDIYMDFHHESADNN